MITRVDNFRVGAWTRLLKIWAPSLLTLVALVGAIGLPLRSLYSTRAEHESATATQRRADALAAEMQSFEALGGSQRLLELDGITRQLLPRDLSTIQINAAMRWIAPSAGIHLHTLSVGDFKPTEFEVLEEAVGMARVNLTGIGTPAAMSSLLDTLRGLGYPTALLDVQFQRAAPHLTEFELSAALGLYEAIPAPPKEELEDLPTETTP